MISNIAGYGGRRERECGKVYTRSLSFFSQKWYTLFSLTFHRPQQVMDMLSFEGWGMQIYPKPIERMRQNLSEQHQCYHSTISSCPERLGHESRVEGCGLRETEILGGRTGCLRGGFLLPEGRATATTGGRQRGLLKYPPWTLISILTNF